jgi:hypothetical protein
MSLLGQARCQKCSAHVCGIPRADLLTNCVLQELEALAKPPESTYACPRFASQVTI